MHIKTEIKEVISSKLLSIKVQDVTLVILCALVIYLFRVRDEHVLSPQWRHHFDLSAYPNGKFPTYENRLPLPIVTDLESDGVSEVVLITNAHRLEIHILPPTKYHEILPHLEVKNSTQLPTRHIDEASGIPVAIDTGFLMAYHNDGRKQVIVVLLDNWTVLCYSSELQVLWQQTLLDVGEVREDYFIKSASILITSAQVARSATGLVVVGASFAHKAHKPITKTWESLDTRGIHPAKQHRAYVDSEKSNTDAKSDTVTHFSTFGLSGTDGSVRWHHLPGDFVAKPEEEVPIPHWKLGLKRSLSHIGEEPWTKFSDALKKTLPYSWSSLYDTRMELEKLHKNRRVQTLEKPASPLDSSTASQDLLGLSAHHLIGAAYGGMKPHSRHEHVENPNVVVIHNHLGIEVLGLTTGAPVTRMEFLDEKAAFADVNGDGNLERLKANFADESCQAEVATLQPSLQVLYIGEICSSPSFWGSLSGSFSQYVDVSEDTHVSLAPVLVKSVAQRSSPMQHLLGHTLPSQRQGYDTIYMTSTAKLTSYGPFGDFNWQSSISAGWADISHAVQTGSFAGNHWQEMFMTSFHPSITPFTHEIYNRKTLLLAVGWDTLNVVNLVDGHLVAEHTIPCQPTGPPVLGDYNNDGFNDIIITCPLGYLGFVLESRPNYVYMGLVSVTVVLTILLLTWCFRPEAQHADFDD